MFCIYFNVFVNNLVKQMSDTNICSHSVYLHVLVLTQAEEESRSSPESYHKIKS